MVFRLGIAPPVIVAAVTLKGGHDSLSRRQIINKVTAGGQVDYTGHFPEASYPIIISTLQDKATTNVSP
jgi:hypothetical protein